MDKLKLDIQRFAPTPPTSGNLIDEDCLYEYHQNIERDYAPKTTTGTLSSLTTTDKTNLVSAINEVNGNCDFEDFTSKVTFSETSRGACYFIRVGKIVYVYYCGKSAAHSAGTVLVTIPEGYRPSYQAAAPFIKNGNAYGFLTFNDNGSKMTVNTISSTSATGRIYANFTYFLD